jgi:hypothetical protein
LSSERTRFASAAAALVLVLGLASCDLQTIDEFPCPTQGTALTYDNFGATFLNGYCQPCHGAHGPGRNGAPAAYDFATVLDARGWRDRIFARAASINTTMPPGPDDPSEEERNQLAEWLSCGAP